MRAALHQRLGGSSAACSAPSPPPLPMGPHQRQHEAGLTSLQLQREAGHVPQGASACIASIAVPVHPIPIPTHSPQHSHEARPPPLGDSLVVDYRTQLRRASQQLAAQDAEAAALRQQVADLQRSLAAAEGRVEQAGEQAARSNAAAGQAQEAAAGMERQLAQREAEVGAARQQRRAAEQAATAAQAAATAAQKAAAARTAEYERDRKRLEEQVERKEGELHGLEVALRQAGAELARRSREAAQREAAQAATHSRASGAASAAAAEATAAADRLAAECKRVRALEAANAELRRHKAAAAADLRMLGELLAESDAERRELHDKYVKLGERMEAVVKEGRVLRSSASAESGAARAAVQDALKGTEAAAQERATLLDRVQRLQRRLEEEASGRAALRDKAQRKLAAAEQEASLLRSELAAKAERLAQLQGEAKTAQGEAESKLAASEHHLAASRERVAALQLELEAERKRGTQAREEVEARAAERLQVELQQQALQFGRRIQELELQHSLQAPGAGPVGPSAIELRGGAVLDYIPRFEHVRVLEARLAAQAADLQRELGSKVAQLEREWQWKLEGKEAEVAGLTARTRQLEEGLHVERQRASAQALQLGDEARRLEAQCLGLQRELAESGKEVARLKEAFKDARSAHADLDDGALSAGRQLARLRHAVEEAQGAVREAQAALAHELKRGEAARRETTALAALAADEAQRAQRAASEADELRAALEQRQELVAALQAEADAGSCKLMAQRERHESELEALRCHMRLEGDARVAALEQQCKAATAKLLEGLRQQAEAAAQLQRQHDAQESLLGSQLAAAECCNAELRGLAAAQAGDAGKQQEDVQALRGEVEELQRQLCEAHSEREQQQRRHSEHLTALGSALHSRLTDDQRGPQQAQLRVEVPGEMTAGWAACLSSCEAGLAALREQQHQAAAAAASQRAEADAVAERLRQALQLLLEAVRAASGVDLQLPEQWVEGAAHGGDASAAPAAAQQVTLAIQQHVERSSTAAVDVALSAMEAALQPAEQSSLSPPVEGGAHGLEAASQDRLAVHLQRARQLLERGAAGDALVASLRQRVADLEGAAAAHAEQLLQAHSETAAAAEAARAAAMAPLQAEVAQIVEQVLHMRRGEGSEMAAVETTLPPQHQVTAVVDRVAEAADCSSSRLSAREVPVAKVVDLDCLQGELARLMQRPVKDASWKG